VLEKAGFTLTTAKPLQKLADEVDAVGYPEASMDKVLLLATAAIELPPGVLSLVGTLTICLHGTCYRLTWHVLPR
jgi:hypothetical protein